MDKETYAKVEEARQLYNKLMEALPNQDGYKLYQMYMLKEIADKLDKIWMEI